MHPQIEQFYKEVQQNIERLGLDYGLQELSNTWIEQISKYKYAYNFTWMGRPIIQFPQDMIAMQEIIWDIKPDLIIETGVAHGGSLIYYASLLELIGENGKVVGVDIEIRKHNRHEIENHSMSKRIQLIEGDSTSDAVHAELLDVLADKKRVLVILDSNHTHEHVLKELHMYSTFVTQGSYLVVFDTIVEDMPDEFFPDRPWGRGNNPKTAVVEFLNQNDRFVIDRSIQHKVLLTVAPDGYLKCVKE